MTAQETIQALKEMGLSYYRIAKDTGLNPRSLVNWHQGIVKPHKFGGEAAAKTLKDYYLAKV